MGVLGRCDDRRREALARLKPRVSPRALGMDPKKATSAEGAKEIWALVQTIMCRKFDRRLSIQTEHRISITGFCRAFSAGRSFYAVPRPRRLSPAAAGLSSFQRFAPLNVPPITFHLSPFTSPLAADTQIFSHQIIEQPGR